MTKLLKVGDSFPKFELKDHKGYEVTNRSLMGSCCVVYFYPKDDTPGCTIEACAFRDHLLEFDQNEALLIGISPDGPESHQKFIDKHQLKFTLLCDEKKELCKACGILDEKNHFTRSTFLIDSKGKIVWIESPANVAEHAERVLAAIKTYCPPTRSNLSSLETDYKPFFKEKLNLSADQKEKEQQILEKFGLKKREKTND